ncbi:MAG: hypothetical protein ABWY18_05270 [Tardiphaga sp.]
MKILWDERKRLINSDRPGLDFADLDEGFFTRAFIGPARQGRRRAVGRLSDGTIVVIFATLGTEAFNVTSMRPANREERKLVDG